ncbi:MAG: DNA mismatch repair protein MutS [Clostridia bacterium]|nr:DNA mismatch repair protein MutS [Clostridia bacterium]
MPLTPMMLQYLSIKEQNPEAILFFRLGDFYEMFFEDAKLVSRELELTLTGKDCGLPERAPMCGVPFHAADIYIGKLIEKGYKVAICEQTEDPALAKGLVKREVIRVVSPGTVIDANMLDEGAANYIMSACLRKNQAGIAFCDVSTGEFFVCQMNDIKLRLADELARIAPSEVLTNDREYFDGFSTGLKAYQYDEEKYQYAVAAKALKAHFGEDVSALGLDSRRLAVSAAGALLAYLASTQKVSLAHILSVKNYDSEPHMELDRIALRNLELSRTIQGSRKGALLSVLDRASTAMGSRMIRSWIEQPLGDKAAIDKRLDAVAAFCNDPMNAQSMREMLSGVYDVERLLSRIAYESVNPRDCLALLASLDVIPMLKERGSAFSGELLPELFDSLDSMDDVRTELRKAISSEAPLAAKDGGIFLAGYNDELDQLRDVSRNGLEYVHALEQREKDATGIKNLKVSYNRVFGYYIEVSKSNYSLVPYHYVRKQTLANCERFITEELKELEQKILGAEEHALRLEYQLFCDIRDRLKDRLSILQTNAHALKTIDALLSLACVAQENEYARPTINLDGRYEIRDGRHPVVEESIGREKFVPNDTLLNADQRVMIITGPNMAGKSTYMRQVALIVLMAHIGSFVPASYADIALTDRIFTRIGASDDLYGGLSTFMVEMSEMATILKFATERSLLILDEVGRGTSTFDGLSIAWASVEHIAGEKCGARTLFATHYHELSELEGQLPGVVNYRITAKEQGDDVIFLRKIVPGGEDRSYGVAVAKLAGLPNHVVSRARQIMARLEVDDIQKGSIGKSILDKSKNAGDRQVSMLEFKPMELVEEISALDVVSMTPIEALNKLFELNEKARRI